LVHQNEGGSGDRPAVLAGLVGQDVIETGGVFPVGAGRRGLESLVVRRYEDAILVLQQGIRHLVLLDIRVLDIAYRPLYALHEGGEALVARAARARRRRPGDGGVVADLVLPLAADLGEVVGKDESRAGAVGAVHDRDRLVGQPDIPVETSNPGVVPLADLPEI